MICPNCGTLVPDNERFCYECGYAFADPAPAAPEAAPTPTPPIDTLSFTPPPAAAAAPAAPAARTVPPAPAVVPLPEAPPVMDSGPAAPALGAGAFFGMDILAAIPVVGLVFLVIWAFSGRINPNRRNWAVSRLLWHLIGLIGLAAVAILLWLEVIPLALSQFPAWWQQTLLLFS